MISEREIRSQGILKEKSVKVQMSSTDELQYIKSKSTRYAVAAMDLGTAFSGCAYSQNKKWHIVNVHHWSTGCFISNKVSTAMLLNPDQTFRAFGYDAEQIYSSLVEIDMNDDGKIITKDNSNDYYFFQRFTVLQNLDSKSYIEDITGKKMKAITIFSMLINYFKNELIETMNRSIAIGTISESDVFFVLTVPANCGERAKHFIRKAAKTAEIKANQLSIVFEEEAVASYCQHMHLDNYDATIDKLLKKEKKCMVVDLGADSVKVAVLEFAADGTLKKLYPPTRENCGGISVDEEFEKFMENIGGEGIMKSFAKDHIEDFLMMQREFETKKRESSNKAIKIRIPESFHKTLKKRYNGGMEAALHLSPYRDIVSFFSFKLILPPEVFKTFFNKTIQNVSNLITQNPQKGGVKSIIMVGGLAGSEIIRDSLRERFSDTYVIVTPPEAELAVLKGAVYLGHIPNSKSSQVQCLTYT